MKSRKISTQSKDAGLPAQAGLTLVETLISMGVLAVLFGVSLPITLNFYQGFRLDAERNSFVTYLRQARSMSLAGHGSKAHGVYQDTTQFTVFEGSSYATRDQAKDQFFARDDTITIAGPGEITFYYLNGKTASLSFTLASSGKQKKVQVNSEGRISYE